MTSLTAEEVLRWNDSNATQWRNLLSRYPNALTLRCDIRGSFRRAGTYVVSCDEVILTP